VTFFALTLIGSMILAVVTRVEGAIGFVQKPYRIAELTHRGGQNPPARHARNVAALGRKTVNS
jgi:hypothetical protein